MRKKESKIYKGKYIGELEHCCKTSVKRDLTEAVKKKQWESLEGEHLLPGDSKVSEMNWQNNSKVFWMVLVV